MLKIPEPAWTPAVEPGGEIPDGAWVAELTGNVLDGWPQGIRLIVRKERPHPGAQLRITDADGMRITCFTLGATAIALVPLAVRFGTRSRHEKAVTSDAPAPTGASEA